MFGMGGSEIIVILIVALLFLGPDKLPQAAKSISKGIRDIKKQSRALQQQIESDEQIGGAIRDLKSALRGEDLPLRPKPFTPPPQAQLAEGAAEGAAVIGVAAAGAADPHADGGASPAEGPADPEAAPVTGIRDPLAIANATAPLPTQTQATQARGPLKLPPTAGEADPVDEPASAEGEDLGSLIKPAPGTVAKGS